MTERRSSVVSVPPHRKERFIPACGLRIKDFAEWIWGGQGPITVGRGAEFRRIEPWADVFSPGRS